MYKHFGLGEHSDGYAKNLVLKKEYAVHWDSYMLFTVLLAVAKIYQWFLNIFPMVYKEAGAMVHQLNKTEFILSKNSLVRICQLIL